jgi:serine/threonine protein kinase
MDPTNLKLGQYKILNLLGKGGMATVYLGEHETLGKKVAVKILNDDLAENSNLRSRFLSEAKSMANMSHPNIIPVVDLIEDDNNVAFVMEYVEGQTLKKYITEKKSLSNTEIKAILSQIMDALKYVHDKGMIHRDIKPSNFMISAEGKIKLLDFGIAKNMDASIADYTQTQTTQQMGTPMYMSPEQIKSTKNVTAHTDIYSLGVLLWEMVKGTAPYNTSSISTFELQTKIVNEPLALTNTIWDTIIQKATAKSLSDRYAEMNQLISAVQNIGIKESHPDRKKVIQQVEKKPIAELLKGGIKGNVVFETMYYVVLLSFWGLADAVIYKGVEASWLMIIQLILIIRVLYGFNQYLVNYLDFKKSTFSTYIFMSALLVFPIFYAVGKGMGFSENRTLSSGQAFFLIGGFLYGIVFIYASFRLFINLFLVKGPGIIYFRIIGAFVFLSILAIVVVLITTKGNLPTEPISFLEYFIGLIFDGVLFMGFWEAYKAFGSAKKSA